MALQQSHVVANVQFYTVLKQQGRLGIFSRNMIKLNNVFMSMITVPVQIVVARL